MGNEIAYNDGILLVDKESGISSYDVIRKIKPFFPRKHKIGHAGTLDPFASGLLIILSGKATKLSNNFIQMDKEYYFRAEFGYETDTQDIEGIKIAQDDREITERELEIVIQNFKGKYLQTPPQFSAKKVKGRSAYKYAREGKKVDLKPKEVEVKEIRIETYEWPYVNMNAVVSSGLYIRKLVVDIARTLETYANTVELRRIKIGEFDVSEAVSSEQLRKDLIMSKLITEIDG